jgi:hypothetical protein
MSEESSSPLGSPALRIAGRTFQLHHPRGDHNHLYCSGDAYLRIGSRAELEPEYETHIRMLQLGFPVPKVLESGSGQPADR